MKRDGLWLLLCCQRDKTSTSDNLVVFDTAVVCGCALVPLFLGCVAIYGSFEVEIEIHRGSYKEGSGTRHRILSPSSFPPPSLSPFLLSRVDRFLSSLPHPHSLLEITFSLLDTLSASS